MKRIAINGLGRIGRCMLRIILEKSELEIVAINDLADINTLIHLMKYDSVHGKWHKKIIKESETEISIDGKKIKILSQKDPSLLPWKDLKIDIVIECTGLFLNKESAQKHIIAGAKKVILSAPPTDADIKTIVLGVNDQLLTKEDLIISNASCTTNCAAPMIKVLHDNWHIEDVYVSTIHSYTLDQKLHDAPHSDLRRARAAALSIVPTTTGAAKALTKIFPDLEGRMGGCGIRVPVPDGSLTDITCILKETPSVKEINAAFKKAAETELIHIMEYTEDPIVSVDVINNPNSCLFDSDFTSVVGNMVKVIGWYDNEWGYSNRLYDLAVRLGQI
jgi:glyceraldehyde 3-phosphate dehydrogenase